MANTMMVGKAILFLITMTTAKHHHKRHDDLNTEVNFFDNVYVSIHSILDNLFESIGISTNFSEAFNTKLLLTMHYDLSNIADKNLEVFRDIQNIIELDTRNEALQVVELDPTVEEVLNENNYDAYGAFKETKKHNKKTKDEEQSMNVTDIPEFADSEEFAEFIVGLLAKVNNLTIQNYKKKSKNAGVAVPSKKNLKVWEGITNTELDFFNMTNTRRLFGGIKTQVNKFPFMVSIHIMGEFVCAGSLIHRDLVITAASCLQIAYQNDYLKTNLKAIYVRLGSDYTTRDGETIPVQNLHVHPAYDPETLSHNVAIISLEKRHRFSRQQKRIRRILFDKTPENMTNIGEGILTLGWGATKKGQDTQKHPKLTMDILALLPVEDCARKYPVDLISNDNFCVGAKNSSRGACNGDLGGPAIVGAELMGIVSYGDSDCGAPNSLTVFTKLGYYTKWIENILIMHKKTSRSYEHHKGTRRYLNDKGFLRLNMSAVQNQKLWKQMEDYPEEVKVLKDILIDLVKEDNDNKIVDKVIYGDLYNDFTNTLNTETDKAITTTEKLNPITAKTKSHKRKRMPVNTAATTSSPDTTPLTPIITVNIDSFLKSLIPLSGFLQNEVKSPPNITDDESENEANGSDYTDNYEQSSDEYGLSIEVPSTQKIRLKNQRYHQTTKESIKTKASSKFTKNPFIRTKKNTRATDKPEQNIEESLKVDFGHAGLLRIDLDELATNLNSEDKTDLADTQVDSDEETEDNQSDDSGTDSDKMNSNVDSDEIETNSENTETTRYTHFVGTRIDYDVDQDALRNHLRNKKIIMRNQGPSTEPTEPADSSISTATRPLYLDLDSDLSYSDSKEITDKTTTKSTAATAIQISIDLKETPKEKGKESFLSNFIMAL